MSLGAIGVNFTQIKCHLSLNSCLRPILPLYVNSYPNYGKTRNIYHFSGGGILRKYLGVELFSGVQGLQVGIVMSVQGAKMHIFILRLV